MTDATLQQFVRQIERIHEERHSLGLDISEFFKSAKQQGYDVAVLRRVIQERRKGDAERREQGALFETYWAAVSGEPVREAAE
jgi:uncharacterized protein (UPF0335 family)